MAAKQVRLQEFNFECMESMTDSFDTNILIQSSLEQLV